MLALPMLKMSPQAAIWLQMQVGEFHKMTQALGLPRSLKIWPEISPQQFNNSALANLTAGISKKVSNFTGNLMGNQSGNQS